jgi:S-adenosyl methyltransferase
MMLGSGRYPTSRRRIDLNQPNIARVYDYYLGGTTNWAVDRYFVEQVLERSTLMRDIACSNQVFLNRVIHYLVKQGVRQFIDIEPGALTQGSTHQVADALSVAAGQVPDVRVVYTSADPITVAYMELALDRDGDPRRHAVVEADLHQPAELWQELEESDILDLSKPVAVLLIAALHVQQRPQEGCCSSVEAVAELQARLPSDSYVALSHLTDDVSADVYERLAEVGRLYDAWTGSSVVCRSRAEIEQMLAGLNLIEPGWTRPSSWHSEDEATAPAARPSPAAICAGLGHKR